jgi:hypothetical protein
MSTLEYTRLNFPVVLYWCETWSFDSKRGTVGGGGTQEQGTEENTGTEEGLSGGENCMMRSFVNSSPSIIRMIKTRRVRCTGSVAQMGEKSSLSRLLVGKPERRRPLGEPRYRWVDSIKMKLGREDGGVLTGMVWLWTESSCK